MWKIVLWWYSPTCGLGDLVVPVTLLKLEQFHMRLGYNVRHTAGPLLTCRPSVLVHFVCNYKVRNFPDTVHAQYSVHIRMQHIQSLICLQERSTRTVVHRIPPTFVQAASSVGIQTANLVVFVGIMGSILMAHVKVGDAIQTNNA